MAQNLVLINFGLDFVIEIIKFEFLKKLESFISFKNIFIPEKLHNSDVSYIFILLFVTQLYFYHAHYDYERLAD